jgi:hypothetical protein
MKIEIIKDIHHDWRRRRRKRWEYLKMAMPKKVVDTKYAGGHNKKWGECVT